MNKNSMFFLTLMISVVTVLFNPAASMAWEQGASGTHEEINKRAANRFFSSSSGNQKYARSPVDKARRYWGTEITSATLGASDLAVKKSNFTFSQWVAHGGFSADEPEVWACVRHFYDPLAIAGVPQLTDHLSLHSFAYPTMSAKQWAFQDPYNPYSLDRSLEYYKLAMEIPVESEISVVSGTGFRDPDISVKSASEARDVYLAKAFRALGETMHMVADMTQPSHVRNDSHPSIDLDPVESTVNRETVKIVMESPVEPRISALIDSADDIETLYERIAVFINENFYTDDTIYDKALGVKPRNWENPYPFPQFYEHTLDTKSSLKTYSRNYNGKPVRMIQQTYTSWKLGERWQDYIIPPAYVVEQAEVLIPIAIKANAKVINLFFPTLDLTLDLKENKGASTNGDGNFREYFLETQMKHLIGSDVEWQRKNQLIKYAGPAELWGEKKGKAVRLADLKFQGGVLAKPVTVFFGEEKYQKSDKFLINGYDSLFIVINAGGRIFKSNKCPVSAPVHLSINPSTLTAEPDSECLFAARASNAPDKARFSWTSDGKEVQSSNSKSFKTRFSSVGNHVVGVKLIDIDGKELASALASVIIEKVSPVEPAPVAAKVEVTSPTPAVSSQLAELQKSKTFKAGVYGLMNINSMTNYVIVNSSEPQNPGVVVNKDVDNAIGFNGFPIKWSGTSFSGESENTGGEYLKNKTRLSGTVANDGNTLLELTYDYSEVYFAQPSRSDADCNRRSLSLKFKNVPLTKWTNIEAELYGENAQKCIVKLDDHITEYRGGKLKTERSYVSSDWSGMATDWQSPGYVARQNYLYVCFFLEEGQ